MKFDRIIKLLKSDLYCGSDQSLMFDNKTMSLLLRYYYTNVSQVKKKKKTNRWEICMLQNINFLTCMSWIYMSIITVDNCIQTCWPKSKVESPGKSKFW